MWPRLMNRHLWANREPQLAFPNLHSDRTGWSETTMRFDESPNTHMGVSEMIAALKGVRGSFRPSFRSGSH